MKLTHEQLLALFALLALCVSAGAYWFVYTRIAVARTELSEVRTELSEVRAREEVHDKLATFLSEVKTDRAELEGYLLARDNPTPFLSLVESLGSETGVTLEVKTLDESSAGNVQQGGEQAKAQTSERYLHVVFAVTGKWEQVYRLLHLFEYLPYVVVLDTVLLEEDEKESRGVWSGQVALRVLER